MACYEVVIADCRLSVITAYSAYKPGAMLRVCLRSRHNSVYICEI